MGEVGPKAAIQPPTSHHNPDTFIPQDQTQVWAKGWLSQTVEACIEAFLSPPKMQITHQICIVLKFMQKEYLYFFLFN